MSRIVMDNSGKTRNEPVVAYLKISRQDSRSSYRRFTPEISGTSSRIL